MCITLVPLVLSMRFGRNFLLKFAIFTPIGIRLGVLSDDIWLTFGFFFSGSDFRYDFGLLLGSVLEHMFTIWDPSGTILAYVGPTVLTQELAFPSTRQNAACTCWGL